jgi:serine/threonine protein kinase
VAVSCDPLGRPFPLPQISDFGLSRVVTSTHRTTKTYGTLNHMAPERLARGTLAPAGDVYAWGIMSECGAPH